MLAVVIPAYNRSQLLREALDSLVAQTKKMFITIVVDDNSSEDLSKVVQDYSKRLKIVYLKQNENRGPGAARNMGLQWCIDHNIEFVLFMDSDDLLMPKAVERLSKEINITNSNIIVSQIQSETKQKIPVQVANPEEIWTHGKIYRVSFLRQHNIFFPELRTNEDLAFNFIAFHVAKINKTVSKLNEQHYIWRNSDGSITRQKDTDSLLIQLSKDFIAAIKNCYDYFLLHDLDVSILFHRVLGAYTYSQYLKELDAFSVEEEKIIKELFGNKQIQDLLIKENNAKENNRLLSMTQGAYFLKRRFLFRENIYDFIKKYGNLKFGEE